MKPWALRMRMRMIELEVTQKSIASQINIPRHQFTSQYARGYRKPGFGLQEKIAATLDCDRAWLFDDESNSPPIATEQPEERKKGGSKLCRSKIVQARLDEELFKAAETMARNQRRTMSSYIEKLIENDAIENYYAIDLSKNLT